MKNQYRVMGLMVVLLTLLLAIPGAQAADVSVGGGIGFKPDYEGSQDYEAVPVPYFNVNFNHGMYIKLLGTNLRFNLIPEKTWYLGPVYNYRAKRSDVENDAVDDMKTVSDAHELGGFGGFLINNWFVSLEFLTDLGDAHDGWYSKLKGGYNWMISNSWALSIGAFTTYADEDYMQTYFGVSAGDAARSGLDRYDADEGIKDAGIELGLNWMITQNWSARGIGSYTQLVGDADDSSPVVDEGSESQFFGAALIVYTF
ncbi:MAG: MipA/OmpV family protein [Desulfobacterales bacterium]|jgi:outer membrane scaffolding protein for murein synthesis (MipA/OmpV family)